MDSEHEGTGKVADNPVDSAFFDTLWPLILNENPCRLESESAEYFVPRQTFDQLHWHSMLSQVGYPGYETPQDLLCCGAAKRQAESEEEAERAQNKAAELQTAAALGDYEKGGSQGIRRVNKEVQHLRRQRERRQKLAYDFANRKYPWTVQTPSHELGFVLTPELRAAFSCPMEREILEAIYHYNCRLMLIDASTEICVEDFKRWVKFRPYVQMLVLVRCPRVERHLQLLNVFQTMVVEENALNTWHQELQSSLRTGLKEAQSRDLFRNCADAFVFIFSRYRGICTCDTYKILRIM
ncbi:hypothetical protein ACLKA7_005347 [Drosophila subpalustris]